MPEREPSSKWLTIVLAVAGGIVFAGLEQVGGLVGGIVLGGLLAQVWHLRARSKALGQEVRELKRRLDVGVTPAPQQPAEVAHSVAASQPVEAAPPPHQPTLQPQPAMVAAAPPAETPEPPRPRVVVKYEPTAFDRLVERGMAWIKGGNPLARIGIVILFFGGAFLAKYAADHSLFPIELRFLLIALGAFTLLFVGWRLRDSQAVYAQILQGGGIAGLYLTFFAATKFELLPIGLALGLMVCVAIAGAVLAVAQNSLSLAVIGTAGGFMAPLLVSTGSGNHIALFTYYALLNLGIFAVAWFRTWRALNVLGFVFTFTITGAWRATGYHSTDLHSTDAFLIVFFLMYVGVSILNAVRQSSNLKGYVSGSLVFGLPVVAFSLHATLLHRIEYALAWSAFALAVFYVTLAFVLFRTRHASFRLLVEAFAALGVIFASLAIPLAFDPGATAAMWAIEGTGLLWLGVRQSRKLPRAFGTLLQLAAAFGYVISPHSVTQPLANPTFIGAVLIAVAGLLSGYWLHRGREQAARYERGAHIAFAFWGTAWWLFAGLNEIDRFVHAQGLGTALAFTAATSIALNVFAERSGWPVPRWIALFLPITSAVLGLGIAFELGHPFAESGALGWAAILLAHYALLRSWETKHDTIDALDRLHASGLWLLAILAASEIGWQVHEHTMGVWRWLPWGLVPALLLALVGRRELIPAWPVAAHATAYRLYGAAPLAVWAYLWILFANLTLNGKADWLPYVPLANPLDVSVALTFVATALWWTSLQPNLGKEQIKALAGAVAVLAFVWLNAALLRALHHIWGAPLSMPAMLQSTLVQASLSIFWGLLGFVAMTTAAKKHWRIVWLVGAALMVIVVAKLFLVDLSKSGTLARIASFLTVGALLLVTGYLAPLPPRRSQESPAA